MPDDEMMDALLRTTLAAPLPRLSDGFDQSVMQRAAPRRLSRMAWATLLVYGIASVVACVWSMRDLPLPMTAVALVIGVAVALGAGTYGSRLARAASAAGPL